MCLLRAVTGIPCPFCGGTTAGVALGEGHLDAALAASPLAVLGVLALLLVPIARGWPERVPARRTRLVGLVLVLLASELWQLHRFSLL